MTRAITEAVKSMQRVSNQRRARQILSILRSRAEDARFIGWPLLEQSLRAELAQAEAVARARGFAV